MRKVQGDPPKGKAVHKMNVLQLALGYQKSLKVHGIEAAFKMLRATGISNALAMEIKLCFDEHGNPLDFDMKQKEYHFT